MSKEPLVTTEEKTATPTIWNDYRLRDDSCMKGARELSEIDVDTLISFGKQMAFESVEGQIVGFAMWHPAGKYTEYDSICANDETVFYSLLRKMVVSALEAGSITLYGYIDARETKEKAWLDRLEVLKYAPWGYTTDEIPQLVSYKAEVDLAALLQSLDKV